MTSLLSCTELGSGTLFLVSMVPLLRTPQGSSQLSPSRSGSRYQAASENPGPRLEVKRAAGPLPVAYSTRETSAY